MRLQPTLVSQEYYSLFKGFPENGLVLNSQRTTIGSSNICDVRCTILPGISNVSKVHCLINIGEHGEATISDTNSSSHVKVNDKVVSHTLLQDRDNITIGNTTFTIRLNEYSSKPFADAGFSKWFLKPETDDTVPIPIYIPNGSSTIGQGITSTIRIPDKATNPINTAIRECAGALEVLDLKSQNGTWVNGKRLENDMETLTEGQTLKIGKSTYRLHSRFS